MPDFVQSVPGNRSFDGPETCPRCSGSLDAVSGKMTCATCGPVDEIMAQAETLSIAERFPQTVAPKRTGKALPPLPGGLSHVQVSPELRKRLIADEENRVAAEKIAGLSDKGEFAAASAAVSEF